MIGRCHKLCPSIVASRDVSNSRTKIQHTVCGFRIPSHFFQFFFSILKFVEECDHVSVNRLGMCQECHVSRVSLRFSGKSGQKAA